MSDIEGPETGHPDNLKLIEREIEHEQSFDIKPAADQSLSYRAAKETKYLWHGGICLLLIVVNFGVSMRLIHVISSADLSDIAAVFIGTVQGGFQAAMMLPLAWFFQSSFSSQNKTKLIQNELDSDNET